MKFSFFTLADGCNHYLFLRAFFWRHLQKGVLRNLLLQNNDAMIITQMIAMQKIFTKRLYLASEYCFFFDVFTSWMKLLHKQAFGLFYVNNFFKDAFDKAFCLWVMF